MSLSATDSRLKHEVDQKLDINKNKRKFNKSTLQIQHDAASIFSCKKIKLASSLLYDEEIDLILKNGESYICSSADVLRQNSLFFEQNLTELDMLPKLEMMRNGEELIELPV